VRGTRPSSDSALRQAERTISDSYVSVRAGEVLLSAVMLLADRHRYRRPRLQAVLLLGVLGETAWMARRLIRTRAHRDRTVLWADAALSAAGLMACEAGLGSGGAAPWAKNVAIGAAIGASSSENPIERLGALSVIGAAGTWAALNARGRDAHVAGWGLALNDVVSWTAIHAAARRYVSIHRRLGELSDDATALTVSSATATAEAAERTTQQERIHRRTLSVLEAIASSTDRDEARNMARAEATRLRNVLRFQGLVPTGLDEVLFDVAEDAAAHGQRVEVVTAELSADVAPDATHAVADAVRVTLAVAREAETASKAVVRATSEDGWITVTIRHHGAFEVRHVAARVAAVQPALSSAGGHVEVWSAEGRGFRVTLRVPSVGAIEHPVDQRAERVPYRGRRGFPTGDDDRAVRNGHVDPSPISGHVGAAQHEVGRPSVAGDLDIGVGGHALEPGPQQRRPGDDAGGRGTAHYSTMTSEPRTVVMRTTPFAESNGANAEEPQRVLQTMTDVWRYGGLGTGMAAVIAGRSRFRSAKVAAATWSLAAVETVWVGRQGGPGRAARHRALIDTATAVATVVIGQLNLAAEDRWTWLDWAPWSFAAVLATSQGLQVGGQRATVPSAAALIAAGIAVPPVRTDSVAYAAGVGAYLGFGHVLGVRLREGEARLRAARDQAVREAARLGAELERGRQLRLTHDHALQTLEAVGSGRYADVGSMRARARDEALRLAGEIDGASRPAGTLIEELTAIAAEHTRAGLIVTVESSYPAPRLSAAVVHALRDACSEALTNVGKHARVQQATVAIAPHRAGVQVTVEDRGVGFNPGREGFGIGESIERRMAEAGGSAEVYSTTGAGTRIVLWAPA
jgi:signal transduction histidine kinase